MTAVKEIRDHAKLFGWTVHADDHRLEDTFVHGEHMVAVNYRKDGTVDQGTRYVFYRITDPQLQEHAAGRNKKSRVVSWLAGLGD